MRPAPAAIHLAGSEPRRLVRGTRTQFTRKPAEPRLPDERQDVGGVGVFRTGRYISPEQVVDLVPDCRMTHTTVTGGLFRAYRGGSELAPDPTGGTATRWRAAFPTHLLGSGALMAAYLTRFVQR